MSKLYTALANFVFITHVTFGAWLLLGWQFETLRISYFLSLVVWILSWVVLRVCLLTYIEFKLRNKAGKVINPGEEFIHYYTKKLFGITLPMSAIYWGGVVTFCVLSFLALDFHKSFL